MARARKTGGLNIDKLIANENVINSDVTDEIESAMLTYAIKTITDRAIPDVRDGLKPVQRRILYSSYNSGFTHNKKYVKNAKIVGEVMGNYHPHGDGSIYEALVAMSQPWSCRYPLIDFHGNNGSYDGDGAAAMRYTEGRLGKTSLELLNDIDNESVNFRQNYSETTMEPEVLPGLFPNLLLNGSSGIATGYTTDIPSHQLGEVVDAIIEVIKNPKCEISHLLKHIKGPDFPGGGYLINNSNILQLYETGKASLTFKGKYEIEENEENDNTQIVFTELPPMTNKPKLVEKIYDLCLDKKIIPRVIDVRDESKGNEIRIVVELHKTSVPDIVINELYSRTALQKNSTYIMRAIVNNTPKMLNLKEIIDYYIEHRQRVITRRTKFLLNKDNARLHIQEGLKIVTDDINKAIEIIKESESSNDAKKELMNNFKISEIQALEVLEIRLKQLTKLNKKDIENLINQLQNNISEYENILSSTSELNKIIISELKTLKKEFNDQRRTTLIDENEARKIEVVSDSTEPIALVLTNKNTIKNIMLTSLDDTFKTGVLKEKKDIFIQGVKCKINDKFLIFLSNGDYVKVEFSDIISGLPFVDEKLKINSIVIYNENDKDKVVIVLTKTGLIKKTVMSGFKARFRRVAPFLQLNDGDEIIGVRVADINDNNIITMTTSEGLIHRFFEKSFKETSAGGIGVNGINLIDGEIVGFDVNSFDNDNNSKIVIFTKHNDGSYGMKSMLLTEFKPKGRMSRGIKGVDFSKKLLGEVYNMIVVNDDFFTVDSKGNVKTHKFVKLSEDSRYNKPTSIKYEASISRFFIENN